MYKLILIFCICSFHCIAQPSFYTTANAHSHNDYEQQNPFWEAYNHGFGSIEADIFLITGNDELLVAHTIAELQLKKRTLDSLYLIPLVNSIKKNGGYPYADKTKKLQLLIDVKTSAIPTLNKLIETINRHPELTSCKNLQFTISGNRPPSELFGRYPGYIKFDGDMKTEYDTKAMEKISLMSANLKAFTLWNGKDVMEVKDSLLLVSVINKYHTLQKPVRFWNAPDDSIAWTTLMRLKVDYINTDNIALLSKMFLRSTPAQHRASNLRKASFNSSCSCNDSALEANGKGIEFHKERSLTKASENYDHALKFAPPKEVSEKERNIILSFAPLLLTLPNEPFGLKDVIGIMHPNAPWIAYHLFWEDDIDFPDDNDPCDHEIIWVRLNKNRTEIKDYYTYFHGRILQATKQDVEYAGKNHNRAVGLVQWGKHGTMPLSWKKISILSDVKDIEYPYIKQLSTSDTMTLYLYNEGIFKKLSTTGRQSLESPLAKKWPKKFMGNFQDFINFSKPVELKNILKNNGYVIVSCLTNAVINRYFLRYNFAVKTEWPDQICEDIN